MSLTLAVRLMHHLPQVLSRILAYGCAVVLGMVSAWGVIMGGLFGPIGVVAYPLVAALPAWIILGVLTRVQGGAGGQAATV
jgi:branched-subunit amino acid transport protein